MQLTGGIFCNSKIKIPSIKNIRPSTSRARKSLFGVLEHNFALSRRRRVLDVFCGAGTLGFECLSRGVKAAVFIDNSSLALKTVRQNAEHLRVSERIDLFKRDIRRIGSPPSSFMACDLALIDPPWSVDLFTLTLSRFKDRKWLLSSALIVLSSPVNIDFELPLGYVLLKRSICGDHCFSFLSIKAS